MLLTISYHANVRDTYLLTILSVENKSTQSGNKNGTNWNPHRIVK